MREQAEQVRGWLRERHLKRQVIDGLDARNVRQELCVKSGCLRIDQSFNARYKMRRDDCIAVRPFSAFTKMERVGQTIIRNIPAGGSGRYQLAVC